MKCNQIAKEGATPTGDCSNKVDLANLHGDIQAVWKHGKILTFNPRDLCCSELTGCLSFVQTTVAPLLRLISLQRKPVGIAIVTSLLIGRGRKFFADAVMTIALLIADASLQFRCCSKGPICFENGD